MGDVPGMYAIAFHPLWAKDSKLWMGISSKEGSDDVSATVLSYAYLGRLLLLYVC